MSGNRRQWALGGLLAVVLGVVVWFWFDAPRAAPVAASAGRSGPASGDGGGPLPSPEAVRLPALQSGREAPEDAARNPFRFGTRRVGGDAGTAASAPPPPPMLTPVDAPPPTPSGPPPPPPITLKFIGIVEKADGTRLAVLTSGEGVPLSGKEGDIIDGRYRILSIGVESVEVAYADGRGRQTIKLSGQ